MKIDLVSRYFKPLKYSENVIRYVPKLFSAIIGGFSHHFPPYLQYSSPSRQERILSSFRQSFLNKRRSKYCNMRSVAVEKSPRIVKINFKSE